MIVALDSSCIIAALCSWHEAHKAVRVRLSIAVGQDRLVVPGHALVECYAVLTRLPPPHRLTPEVTRQALHGLVEDNASVTSLPALSYWSLLDRAARHGTAGGAIYDALILEAARRAKADELWTLNARHFMRLDHEPMRIANPAR